MQLARFNLQQFVDQRVQAVSDRAYVHLIKACHHHSFSL